MVTNGRERLALAVHEEPRHATPPHQAAGEAPIFQALNLNLKLKLGRAALAELLFSPIHLTNWPQNLACG